MPVQVFLRYLQGFNWAFLALGATLTLVLSVVCLLLYLNLDTAPQYRPQFESTRTSAFLFVAVMLSAAVAVCTQRTQHLLRWPAELLLAAAITVVVLYFLPQ